MQGKMAEEAAECSLTGRDLISILDFSSEEISQLFDLTEAIKETPESFHSALKGKQIVLFFEKASLRTRLTFEAGMMSMGGTSIFVDQTRARLGEREPLSDIAHNVERWVHGVVLRTYAHETVTEMAKYASIPVINALSDLEHPCQAFADFFTLEEKFGDLSQIHMAYVGDGNNVAHSLMLAAAALGTSISIATPEGYAPDAEITATAKRIGRTTGAFIEITHDAVKAVTGANAIYTDVWTSMGQENEAATRAAIFAPYQVNEELFSHAAPHAVFMHCLPAHRGEEVTAGVIDSPRSIVFDQAENRMHIQKAILLLLLGSGMRTSPTRSNHA